MTEHVDKLKIYDKNWQAFLLLVPTMSFLVVFLYYPFLETIWLSFHTSNLLGQDTWVGLDHFVRLFESEEYRHSFLITIAFAAITVGISLLIALVISFLIYEVDRLKGFYLVAAIWPYALPLAVAATIIELLVHPDLGVITYVINDLTGFHLSWYTNGRMAFGVVTLGAIWQGLGYSIIFITAALGQLPETITEAAELDGVSRFKRLFYIYVPLISPTLVFLIVIRSVTAFFGGFALVDLMTSGGPGDATNILIFKLYTDAFRYNQFGFASAQSIVLFVFVAIMMYVQLKVTDRYAFYGG